MDPFKILDYASITEKSIRLVESENKLVFIVRRNANKKQIKEAVEKLFEAGVESVKTSIDQKGRKKAFVKFKQPGMAGDIAMRIGII